MRYVSTRTNVTRWGYRFGFGMSLVGIGGVFIALRRASSRGIGVSSGGGLGSPVGFPFCILSGLSFGDFFVSFIPHQLTGKSFPLEDNHKSDAVRHRP